MNKNRILSLTYIALFAAVIAVCSYIQIPLIVPFTMQTYGVMTALGLLGGKRGTASITAYVLLGMAGVPVFAGFNAGVQYVMGPTGGFIVGFILTGIVFWLITHYFPKINTIIAFCVSLSACYIFGILWFCAVYLKAFDVGRAFTACVLPFIIPETLKILLSAATVKAVKKYIKNGATR